MVLAQEYLTHNNINGVQRTAQFSVVGNTAEGVH